MLKIAYLLARIGADTAENERIFSQILQKKWQLIDRGRTRPPRARCLPADKGDPVRPEHVPGHEEDVDPPGEPREGGLLP